MKAIKLFVFLGIACCLLVSTSGCEEDALLITRFSITSPISKIGVISPSANEILVKVEPGTNLSNLVGEATFTEGARLTPDIEGGVDFSSREVNFILSKDGESVEYKVIIEVEYPELPETAKNWFRVFDDEGIGAACSIDPQQENVLLFNQDGTRYAQIVGGVLQGYFDVQSSEGIIRDNPFSSVGSAHQFNSKIYVFDDTGAQWASLDGSEEIADGNPLDFGWGGNHPFVEPVFGGPGIGAGLYYSSNRVIHFSKDGTRWVIYDPTNASFTDETALNNWGTIYGGIPFQKVGVALTIYTQLNPIFPEAPTSETDQVFVLFNEEGKEFVFYQFDYGFSEIFSLVE